MRNLINIVTESVDAVEEDCVEHDRIWKSNWSEWRDRDGIYLLLPGSNSCYVGFCTQEEAEEYMQSLEGDWKVQRQGAYRHMTDEEAKASPEIRNQRIRFGMWVEPLSEEPINEEEFAVRVKTMFENRLSEL